MKNSQAPGGLKAYLLTIGLHAAFVRIPVPPAISLQMSPGRAAALQFNCNPDPKPHT